MQRLEVICRVASGFVYHVSLKGITGADHISLGPIAENVARMRKVTDLPVLVGFGIKDGRTAKAVAACADGVVVGAALVSRMGALAERPQAIPDMLRGTVGEIRRALDG